MFIEYNLIIKFCCLVTEQKSFKQLTSYFLNEPYMTLKLHVGVTAVNKTFKNLMLVILDVIAIICSFYVAFYLRFDGDLFGKQAFPYFVTCVRSMSAIIVIKIIVFYFFKLYKSLWSYASIEEVLQVLLASLGANCAIFLYMLLNSLSLPRSIYILTMILDMILICGIRFSYRVLRKLRFRTNIYKNRKTYKKVMIIGAGEASALVIKELKNSKYLNSRAVVAIDDDIKKLGKRINGVPILGTRYNVLKLAEEHNIDEIIIAIPSADNSQIREIVEECSKSKCKLRILPGMYELIDGKVSINKIRDVQIKDLLGREPIKVDLQEMSSYISNKVILVTGGGGSIGSELCRQIADIEPKQLLILDIYENNAYDIQNELLRKYPELKLQVIIASIRDRKRMEEIFDTYRPNVVFHAAAHKHVPLMEDNPQEAIKNNVFGTLNVAECADIYGVEKFVLISTDKAVNPTNIMGATKRITEMIVQSLSKISETEYVAVRFGNVLGSNGSVIPLFKKQIEKGGPVTVTHPEITRFFMTIPEAVQLVIQAGAMAKGGEIFVLDMGEPVKILELAENLIRLLGYEPYQDIDISFVGLRPGEKLYEELLLTEEGLLETKNNKIFIGQPLDINYTELMVQLDKLRKVSYDNKEAIIKQIKHIVPTYKRVIYEDDINSVNVQPKQKTLAKEKINKKEILNEAI